MGDRDKDGMVSREKRKGEPGIKQGRISWGSKLSVLRVIISITGTFFWAAHLSG